MNNIDPRTKLIQVLILSTLALIYNEIFVLSIILFAAIMIALINNVNFISVISRFKKLLKIIFLIALIQSLLTNMGNPILKIGNFTVFTDYGILKSDIKKYNNIYEYCINCGECAENCPAGAISLEKGKDHKKCSDFLDKVKEKHKPYYGCGKCQVCVPCENENPKD
jgi:ferredoxin